LATIGAVRDRGRGAVCVHEMPSVAGNNRKSTLKSTLIERYWPHMFHLGIGGPLPEDRRWQDREPVRGGLSGPDRLIWAMYRAASGAGFRDSDSPKVAPNLGGMKKPRAVIQPRWSICALGKKAERIGTAKARYVARVSAVLLVAGGISPDKRGQSSHTWSKRSWMSLGDGNTESSGR
jgi:hypothetical protein